MRTAGNGQIIMTAFEPVEVYLGEDVVGLVEEEDGEGVEEVVLQSARLHQKIPKRIDKSHCHDYLNTQGNNEKNQLDFLEAARLPLEELLLD